MNTCLAPCAEAKPALDPYGVAVSDLVARAVHCCYGGNWAARLGGIAALECLVPRLPMASLPRLGPSVAKAIFAVLRIVPEHASEEQQLGSLLNTMLARCGGTSPAAGADASGTAVRSTAAATAPADAVPTDGMSSGSSAEGPQLPPLVKQLMEIFVQHLLSSRSSVAVRGVASNGLQVRAAADECSNRKAVGRCPNALVPVCGLAQAGHRRRTWLNSGRPAQAAHQGL